MEIGRGRELDFFIEDIASEYIKGVKKQDLESIENEIAVMGNAIGNIPTEYMELPLQAQGLVIYYNDRQFKNQLTNRHTYQDIVESYIAVMNQKEVDWFSSKVGYLESHRNENDELVTTFKVLDNLLWAKFKTNIMAYWKIYNLKSLVKTMRELQRGDLKDRELITTAIVDDALYNDDATIRIRSRQQAIKVLGMEKSANDNFTDVWNNKGGKVFAKITAEFTGNKTFDYDSLIVDIDNEADSE